MYGSPDNQMNEEEKKEPSEPEDVPHKTYWTVPIPNGTKELTQALQEASKRISEQVSLVGKQFGKFNTRIGDLGVDPLSLTP
jgi:hypothetical protein